MAQHNVWFLEPQQINAQRPNGVPVEFDPEPGNYGTMHLHGEALRDAYYESVFAMKRCTWQNCAEVLRDARIPLCYKHSQRVWAYVDHYESEAERELARKGLQSKLEVDAAAEAAGDAAEAAYRERYRGKKTEPGDIYYLRMGDLVKIGFTTSLDRRLKEYPPNAELLTQHPGTLQLESEIHSKFRRYLALGREWFKRDPVLMRHIESVESARLATERARQEELKHRHIRPVPARSAA